MPYFFVLLVLMLTSSLQTFAQADPLNIPKPPTAQLKIYEPFYGKYNMTSQYGGLTFNGTIEVKPVIKGWYVEQTILVKGEGTSIDREFRMMVTYDTMQQQYRVWRFETLPPTTAESKLRTEGADIIIEMQMPPMKEGAASTIFYNRYSMVSKDTMKIVSDIRSADGKVLQPVGVSTATRIK